MKKPKSTRLEANDDANAPAIIEASIDGEAEDDDSVEEEDE